MEILQWISCNYYQLSSFFSVIQFLGEILTNCCMQLCNATDQSDHHQGVLDFGLANVKANAHGALIAFSPDLRGSHCWQVSITTTSIWNFYGNILFNCLDFPFVDPTAATLIFMVKNYSHIIKGLPVPALITRPTRRTISVRTTRTAEQDRTRNSVSGTIITKTTISSSVSCFFLWQSLFYPKLLLKFTHSMHIRRLGALLTSTGLTRSTVLRLSRDLSTWI